MTTEASEALVATLNFIGIWIKLFVYNYDARSVAYITSMKEICWEHMFRYWPISNTDLIIFISRLFFIMCNYRTQEIISIGSCMCYKISKKTSMQPWTYGCVWSRVRNLRWTTNLVTIYSNIEVPKYKPASFLQLIHLIDMASNLYPSSIKRNSNMAKTFNEN